jgi:hypothetical protein
MWDRGRAVFSVVAFTLALVLCFLTVHPNFDVFLHQDAASRSTTALLTSLSSARRAIRIISSLGYVVAEAFAPLSSRSPGVATEAMKYGQVSGFTLAPLSRSEILLI